jgi:hypothetical protein
MKQGPSGELRVPAAAMQKRLGEPVPSVLALFRIGISDARPRLRVRSVNALRPTQSSSGAIPSAH